uniref:Secreted protein n=1 Tax=Angiostrongylus cantonensis TaxID=6313 RepID=A0A0K0DIW2_ANGCA
MRAKLRHQSETIVFFLLSLGLDDHYRTRPDDQFSDSRPYPRPAFSGSDYYYDSVIGFHLQLTLNDIKTPERCFFVRKELPEMCQHIRIIIYFFSLSAICFRLP